MRALVWLINVTVDDLRHSWRPPCPIPYFILGAILGLGAAWLFP